MLSRLTLTSLNNSSDEDSSSSDESCMEVTSEGEGMEEEDAGVQRPSLQLTGGFQWDIDTSVLGGGGAGEQASSCSDSDGETERREEEEVGELLTILIRIAILMTHCIICPSSWCLSQPLLLPWS